MSNRFSRRYSIGNALNMHEIHHLFVCLHFSKPTTHHMYQYYLHNSSIWKYLNTRMRIICAPKSLHVSSDIHGHLKICLQSFKFQVCISIWSRHGTLAAAPPHVEERHHGKEMKGTPAMFISVLTCADEALALGPWEPKSEQCGNHRDKEICNTFCLGRKIGGYIDW